jgi:hypothetical protein
MSRFETVREVENRSYRSSDRVHCPYPSLPASYAPRSPHGCTIALRCFMLHVSCCASDILEESVRNRMSRWNQSPPARRPLRFWLSSLRFRFKPPWRARRSCSKVRIGSVCVLALIPHPSDPNRNEETTVFRRVSQSGGSGVGLVISDEIAS